MLATRSALARDATGVWRRAAMVVCVLLTFVMIAGSLVAAPVSPEATATDSDAAAEPAPAAIDVISNAASDAAVARRLRQLYANTEGLEGVQVDVTAGVVTLSGEVASRAARDEALALARRVETVVTVQEDLVESRDVGTRIFPTLNRMLEQAQRFIALLPLLGVALVIVALFWWLSRLVAGSSTFLRMFRRNPFLRDLAAQVVRLGIFIIGVVLALEILDASRLLTTLLGAAGVMGLALGFALRDTVENYIASLLLSLRQPFARDDLVVIEGCEGRVVRLTPRATILMTLDGNHTRIPNARVYKAVITNYTRNPKRRFCFDVGVDTEQNLAEAQELAARTLLGMNGVLADPAPSCTVETLGESNVVLRVYGWIDQASADFLRVRSEAIRLVKLAFDQAGIVMPEPIYNLRMRTLPPAPETVPAEEPTLAGAARFGTRRAQPGSTARNEPATSIDVGKQDDLDQQIAAERDAATEDDLLSPHAPKE
jgi:small conductance mechanosensitive channel